MTILDMKDKLNNSGHNRVYVTPYSQKEWDNDDQEDIAQIDRENGYFFTDEIVENLVKDDPEWDSILNELSVVEMDGNVIYVDK